MSRPDVRSILRNDKLPDGRKLSAKERERLVKPFLPASPRNASSPTRDDPQQATRSTVKKSKASKLAAFTPRSLINTILHRLLFLLIQLVFSIYIRTRQTYHSIRGRVASILYYHHRSPELIRQDVKNLDKLPRHLSVIVELKSTHSREAVDELLGEVAELAAWCACAGIAMLSVYERTGAIKSVIPNFYHTTMNTFISYFPRDQRPTLHISSPDITAYSPSPSPSRSPSPVPHQSDGPSDSRGSRTHLNILLLSAQDGRGTLVDLTKTLAEMSQKGKIKPSDVTTELIHAEIEEGSGCTEPDLLVIMSPSRSEVYGKSRVGKSRRKKGSGTAPSADGSTAHPNHHWAGDGVCLQGYPPWQVRLTEIL